MRKHVPGLASRAWNDDQTSVTMRMRSKSLFNDVFDAEIRDETVWKRVLWLVVVVVVDIIHHGTPPQGVLAL